MRFHSLSLATLVLAAVFIPTHTAKSQPSSDKAIIVFDGSGSMWGQISGKSKIEIARETMSRVVGTLPGNLELGLIAYGHNRKGDCNDIETLVDVGPTSKTGEQIAQSVQKISPKGKTPLSEAVKRAAKILRYTEDKATVILVTDGIETCNADPCALAKQLEQDGINFTTHVVGFDLSKDEGRQVACLAENTGGLYLEANNTDQLADAIGQTVAIAPAAPEPELRERPDFNLLGKLALVEGAEPLPEEATKGSVRWFIQALDAQGSPGNRVLIDRDHEAQWYGEENDYLLSVEYPAGGVFEQTIALTEFDVTDEIYTLNAARMAGVATFMQGSYNIDWAALEWSILNTKTDKKVTAYGYDLDIIVPPGNYDISLGLRGESPLVNKPRSVALNAGDTLPLDFILPHSKVTFTTKETDGTPNDAIRQKISMRNADGTAGNVIEYEASSKPVFLRPGQYLAAIEIWDGTRRKPVELPIDIGLAEIQNFDVTLP